MKKGLLIRFGFLAGLFALVAAGCGGHGPDRRPCAEDLPCLPPAVNACQDRNLSLNRWTSLGLENERVSAIAVHPCNPGIIYAGTSRDFSAGVRGKLFKSADCGQTWDTLAVGGSYRTIQFSPGNPEVIYAVNGDILKSTDSGASWQRADEGIHIDAETGVSALAINPRKACTIYAGTGGFYGGGLYKSTDAGAGWRLVEGKGLEDLGNNMNRLDSGVSSLAINPADPDHMYVGTAQLGDVLRSTDGGDSWETTGLKDTGSSVNALLVNSENNRKLYTGLDRAGLHISRDSGRSWKLITNEFLADTTSVVELEVGSKNGTLYVATAYGDSGSLLACDLSNDTWKELPVPVTDKSFYYSKLKVHEFGDKVYLYFGLPSGIYARIEE